jgi:comEA protein
MGNILHRIHFTKAETRIILFLIAVLISGLLIKISNNLLFENSNAFDYSRTDKMFRNYKSRISSIQFDTTDNNDTTIFTKKEKEFIEKTNKTQDSIKISEGVKIKPGKKEDLLKGKTINLNSATKEQLMMLPGIGESTAEKILLYRKEHSGFKKPEDIQKIKGIGKKKFEKLKPYITVD